MLTALSLRLRVFLFFCLMGLGGATLTAGALWFAYARSTASVPAEAFVTAGLLSAFALLGLSAIVWLLFDENVSRPIERIASEMRTRTHTDVNGEMSLYAARYLGDLAPAAAGLAGQLDSSSTDAARTIASETARLQRDRDALADLLSEIPVAVAMISADNRIVLYDRQASNMLARICTPRLNSDLTDYLDAADLKKLRDRMNKTGLEARGKVSSRDGAVTFDLCLKPLGQGDAGFLALFETSEDDLDPTAERPLVFDFALLSRDAPDDLSATPLDALSIVVFDTETTGLLPHKDEVVQIGAIHVLNGQMIEADTFETLVNPGMPIPPGSTKVHKISDHMVTHAPDIAVAGRQFHDFARGSVMAAHNAPFDFAFLRRHRRKMGVEWDMPVLDTVLLSAILFGGSESHTLDSLSDRLNVEIPETLRHTALGDAVGTAQVLCKMLPMLKARGFETLGDVIAEAKKHGRLLEDLNT